ncbi:MAG: cation transporter, partial [Desulfovibrio sp.]|nr:cation transporter [Desulfovibrio sp.]
MKQDDLNNAKRNAALISLVAALVLTAVKLAVGLATDSLGILSEALHSGLDLLASGLTMLAVHVAAHPADEGHTYGHGKAENLSALAQTLLLFLTCGWIVWEGAHRLMEGGSPMRPSLWGVGVMLLSMAVDINRVRVLRRVARESQSQALEADALHFSTDILSSAVVLAGVLAAWLAEALRVPAPLASVLTQADTVAALLVAVIIFATSLKMA